MAANCSNEFQRTDEYYRDIFQNQPIEIIVFLGLGVLMCILMLVIFTEAAAFVYRYYSNPTQKVRIIILLSLNPVTGWTSLFALLVPRSTSICHFIDSLYLSICVVLFIELVVGYYGGTQNLFKEMAGKTMNIGCCFKVPFNRKNLRIAHSLTFQVVIIRPILIYTTAVLMSDDNYVPGSVTAIIFDVLNLASFTVALVGLEIIFTATAKKLHMFKITLKKIWLQLTLLFDSQVFLLHILGINGIPECVGGRGSIVRAARMAHFLLVLEMFILTIFSRYVFRRQEAMNLMEYNRNSKQPNKAVRHDRDLEIESAT